MCPVLFYVPGILQKADQHLHKAWICLEENSAVKIKHRRGTACDKEPLHKGWLGKANRDDDTCYKDIKGECIPDGSRCSGPEMLQGWPL